MHSNEAFFVMSFLCLCMHTFFVVHYGLQSLKINGWCSFHYVRIIWNEAIEKNKDVILFFNVIHFDVFCLFDEVWCITLVLYNTSHMTLTHLYFYKNVWNDMGIYFSKGKRKNLHI
jgi:hypothetical protein